MNEIIIALIAFLGTTVGSVLGILQANKLTVYRISQLEDKVNKHNNVVERMAVIENTVKSHQHQIDEIREELLK